MDSSELYDDNDILLRLNFSSKESNGIIILIAVSCISLISVLSLITAISLSVFSTKTSSEQRLLVHSHITTYFICLIVCDLLQAVGSILNSRWISMEGVQVGAVCTAQGILKQTSDIGSAFWTVFIIVHTFCLLILSMKITVFVLSVCLVVGWSVIITIVLIGPSAADVRNHGEFFGISGYWCWISSEYPVERITLGYMIVFIAAFLSLTLSALMLLSLHGYVSIFGETTLFRQETDEGDTESRKEITEDESRLIGKYSLWYTITYTVLRIPIACTRLTIWSGHNVPFKVIIFSATVFLLSGTVNTALFFAIRRALGQQTRPRQQRTWAISRPYVLDRSDTGDCYNQEPASFNTFEASHEKTPPDAASRVTSEAASIPYEHTVRPLEIRKKKPSLPLLDLDHAEKEDRLESVYDIYTDQDLYTPDGWRSDEN